MAKDKKKATENKTPAKPIITVAPAPARKFPRENITLVQTSDGVEFTTSVRMYELYYKHNPKFKPKQ